MAKDFLSTKTIGEDRIDLTEKKTESICIF